VLKRFIDINIVINYLVSRLIIAIMKTFYGQVKLTVSETLIVGRDVSETKNVSIFQSGLTQGNVSYTKHAFFQIADGENKIQTFKKVTGYLLSCQ